MRNLLLTLAGLLIATLLLAVGARAYEEAYVVSGEVGEMPYLELNQALVTVNTTRIGSDDPVETAVAVAQIIYPVTEEENSPGAVILVPQDSLAEVMVAASRVQHFPVNAPLLYVNQDSIPELTRQELLRLQPEGVPADFNTQVYLVGTINPEVIAEVEAMGYTTRVLTADNPIELAVVADNWTSTQHGDHRNEVVIANLDNLEPSIPSAFWNAHRGDGLAFVTNEGVPQETIDLLERRANGPWMYLFGDESVISADIARQLAQYGQVTRIPGNTLPEISAHFAAFHDEGRDWEAWFFQGARAFGWGIGEAGHNVIFTNVDNPNGWLNVMPATTLSHMGKHAPVLMVETDSVPEAVQTYLNITQPYATAPQQQLLNHGWIIGGTDTISWETQASLDWMLEAYSLE